MSDDLAILLVFSPQVCRLPLLEATLTRDRRQLAADLIDQIEAARESGVQRHNLLVGPRGSGKTHVLAYVRKELVRRHPDSGIRVLALSEEERSIASLLDLLLACLRAAGQPMKKVAACLRSVPRCAAESEAWALLQREIGGQTTLLVLENLNQVFDGLREPSVAQLRSFLQGASGLSLLASSCELFSSSSSPDHPFYGFFNLHFLHPLDADETGAFLSALARERGEQRLAVALLDESSRARVLAIHQLTGGSHRLLAILSGLLTIDGLRDLVEPFVRMMDRELTPYYQQRLDRLSPQQNKILEAIAEVEGRAVLVAELVDHTFLSSQTVTRQLHDLLQAGLVRRLSLGRESCYELSEPLLRWILDMKAGREDSLGWVIRVLRLWYENAELERLATAAPEGVRHLYRSALDAPLAAARASLLLEAGRRQEAREEVARALQTVPVGDRGRHLLSQVLLARVSRDPAVAGMLREVFGDDVAGVIGGLLLWVAGLLPLSKEEAQPLVRAEQALRAAFQEEHDVLRTLDLIGALRRDAMGDRKALLSLPIEIRSLILRRLGREDIPESAAQGSRQMRGRTRRRRGSRA